MAKITNASQYRKPPAKRTQVSFFDNDEREFAQQQDPFVHREKETRRDKDTVRDLNISLYDIDYSVREFIDTVIQPSVEEGGEQIKVPVIYASAERWNSIQKNGFMRDSSGKVMAPLIAFRNTTITVDDALRKNRVASVEQSSYLMRKRYSQTHKYDKFSVLQGSRRPSEYFLVSVPEYITLDYEFTIWTQYQRQLNSIIEYFLFWQGKAFGEPNYFKFTSKIDGYSKETVNATGQNRLVRATFTLVTRGYVIPKHIAREQVFKRVVGVSKVVFGVETTVSADDGNVSGYPSAYIYPEGDT